MMITITNTADLLQIADYEPDRQYLISFRDPQIWNFEPRKAVYTREDIEFLHYDLQLEVKQNGTWSEIGSVHIGHAAGLLQVPDMIRDVLNTEQADTVEEYDNGVDIERDYYLSRRTRCTCEDYYELHRIKQHHLYNPFYCLIVSAGDRAVRLSELSEKDVLMLQTAVRDFLGAVIAAYMRRRNEREIQFRELYVPTEKCLWVREYSDEEGQYTGNYSDFFRLGELLEGIRILEEQNGKEEIVLYQCCKITEITSEGITVVGDSYGGNYQLTVPYRKIVELWDDAGARSDLYKMRPDQIAEDFCSALTQQQYQEIFYNGPASCDKYQPVIRLHYALYDAGHSYENGYDPRKDADREHADAFVRQQAEEILREIYYNINPF